MLALAKIMLNTTLNPEGHPQFPELCYHVVLPKGTVISDGPASYTELCKKNNKEEKRIEGEQSSVSDEGPSPIVDPFDSGNRGRPLWN